MTLRFNIPILHQSNHQSGDSYTPNIFPTPDRVTAYSVHKEMLNTDSVFMFSSISRFYNTMKASGKKKTEYIDRQTNRALIIEEVRKMQRKGEKNSLSLGRN